MSPYLKCRGPFIDPLGVPKLWFDYFTTRIKLHGQWGPRLKTSIHRGWLRLLGSRVLMWMVPGTVLGDACASHYFTWMLSLPTWGLI
jgi:hypothetical protein